MGNSIVNSIITGTKALVIGLWALTILGLLSLSLSLSPLITQIQFYVLVLAGIVLLAHFVEYCVMKERMMTKTTIKMSFIQTMMWGYVYWLPILIDSKNKQES